MDDFTVIGYDQSDGCGFCEHVRAEDKFHAMDIAETRVATRCAIGPGYADEFHSVVVLEGHVHPPYVTAGRPWRDGPSQPPDFAVVAPEETE